MFSNSAKQTTTSDQMTSLVSVFNPIVGRAQWKLIDDNYDYCQEVARSAYADMLHDRDRNEKFRQAIETAVKTRRQKKPHSDILVLDIGTGTGLLSMMAVSAGADFVVACEGFTPMANCACKVLKDNEMTDKIHVVPKRSDQLIVGKDLPRKADILVAELLDTEVIGEGALETYRHAAEYLIEDDAEVVPYAVDVYIQIVESPFLWSHHRLGPRFRSSTNAFQKRYTDAFFTSDIEQCPGLPSVFDIQASMLECVKETDEGPPCLRDNQLKCLLSEPLLVKRFNFSLSIKQAALCDKRVITNGNDGRQLTACTAGTAHAVVGWWRVQMESSGRVAPISTAPKWIGDVDSVWRDHWIQAVYFPRQAVTLHRGEPLVVDFCHDSFSLWFDLTSLPASDAEMNNRCAINGDDDNTRLSPERPFCRCGMHTAWSRNRIAHLNSPAYSQCITSMLDRFRLKSAEVPAKEIVHIVVISDCSPFPCLLAEYLIDRPGLQNCHIYHVDASPFSAVFMKSKYEAERDFERISLVESVDQLVPLLSEKLTGGAEPTSVVVLAEPHTAARVLPWDSLYFWYAYHDLRKQLPGVPVELLCPVRMRIWVVAMDFRDLWKIRYPVRTILGEYNVHAFDDMILSAVAKVDAQIEPQPLWEYTGRARSDPTVIFDITFQALPNSNPTSDDSSFHISTSEATFKLSCAAVNGLAFWAEWLMGPVDSKRQVVDAWYVPSGPLTPIICDREVDWSLTDSQGVFLSPPEWKFQLAESESRNLSICVRTDFDPASADFSFTIDLLGNPE